MKKIWVITAILVLSGCASTSDVMSLGADKYLVGSHVRGGLTSWAEVKEMAIKRATEYCASKNLSVEVLSIDTSGTQGWTPQNADVTFKCVKNP